MRFGLAIRLFCTIALALVLTLAGINAAIAQGEGSSPVVAAPSGARQTAHASTAFATYPLITGGIAQRGGIQGNIGATTTVEGALTRHTYQLSAAKNADAVISGYRERLTEAGFNILYGCDGEDCGPTFVRASPGYRAHASVFDAALSSQHYLAARMAGSSGDVYVAVQTARVADGVSVQVDTLRVTPRRVGTISVNAAQMARDLATSGRVALYGIFFNTDSAEIKPESRPTLKEIARLMGNEPNLKLLVVGHTDSRGTFDYNIDLSTRRARSVVDALVDQYGVDSDRLKPWGVGFAAPRASNNSDIGQAKNRRVELVVW